MSTSVAPQVVKDRAAVRALVRSAQAEGKRVGVVMTMGALHEGHLSLVQQSRDECDLTIVTIFVNPTQFLPGEDFEKYPRTLDSDLAALQTVGTDVVFAPETAEMYVAGASTSIQPPRVAEWLEGRFRPGHFSGVCTVVCKLFQTIPADRAYFGSKDYQQFLVIRQMALELDIPVEVIPCPIVRDEDGLALSSRNRYLSPQEKEQALALSRGLRLVAEHVAQGETNGKRLEDVIQQTLLNAGIEKIDYVAIADSDTLEPVAQLEGSAVALIAAHVGNTRLIDNRLLPLPTQTGK